MRPEGHDAVFDNTERCEDGGGELTDETVCAFIHVTRGKGRRTVKPEKISNVTRREIN